MNFRRIVILCALLHIWFSSPAIGMDHPSEPPIKPTVSTRLFKLGILDQNVGCTTSFACSDQSLYVCNPSGVDATTLTIINGHTLEKTTKQLKERFNFHEYLWCSCPQGILIIEQRLPLFLKYINSEGERKKGFIELDGFKIDNIRMMEYHNSALIFQYRNSHNSSNKTCREKSIFFVYDLHERKHLFTHSWFEMIGDVCFIGSNFFAHDVNPETYEESVLVLNVQDFLISPPTITEVVKNHDHPGH